MNYDEIIEMEILHNIDKYFHAMRLEITSLPVVKDKLIEAKTEQKEDLKSTLSHYIDEQFETIVLKDQSF